MQAGHIKSRYVRISHGSDGTTPHKALVSTLSQEKLYDHGPDNLPLNPRGKTNRR